MKNTFLICVVFFLFNSNQSISQEFSQAKKWSLSWGYNRAWFGKSDIHVRGENYDFTVHQVAAKDRQTKFSVKEYFGIQHIWIPQYNYRLGYNFTDKLGVSFGLDHMKYVMVKNQTATISGVVSEEASQKYAGAYLNKPFVISPDLFMFEHTNGLNLFTLDFDYNQRIFNIGKKLALYFQVGAGGIWVVPKTDVRVFEQGLDNKFHLAGYCASAKAGPEIRFLKHFFVKFQLRSGYMYLPDVLVNNPAASERIDHHFTFNEFYGMAGGYFNLGKKKSD